MTDAKTRALANSIYNSIECALCDLVWNEHPIIVEELKNAQELCEIILGQLQDPDDPEELDFEEHCPW